MDISYVILGGIGLVGMLFVSYLVLVQTANKAIKSETRKNTIEQMLQSLGIKNMRAADLNSDKLDELGFARLLTLLRELRQPAMPSGLGGDLASLQSLAQWAQAAKQQTPPQAAPQSQPSNQSPSSEADA